MTSNTNNISLLNSISDIDCQDNDSQIQNSLYPSISDFNCINTFDSKIEHIFFLNKKNLSPSIKYNYKYIQKDGKLDNQNRLSTNDGETVQGNKKSSYNNQKSKSFNIEDSLFSINHLKKKNSNLEKKRGRKRKDNSSIEEPKHNKFTDDNIRTKCKHLVLDSLIKFINKKIKILYNEDIGNNIFRKELLTLNSKQTTDNTVNFNKKFITKKLSEIFSDSISGKFTNFPPEHNKLLIQRLINEEDENKKDYFQKLFDLTFLQCVKHFIGSDHIDELDGMKCFNEIKKQFNEKEYIELLEYYFNNYEEIIMKKKPRNKKKIKGINK